MNIRFAKPEDAKALLEIYAQYIDTPVTFEYALPSVDEFEQRIISTLKQFPYLVAEEGQKIIGYAYAHQLREREAYQWSAELSIYFDRTATRHGYGVQLYNVLFEILRKQGVRTLFACITSPNQSSEHFHLKMGFEKTGVLPHAGWKDNAWHDVVWYTKTIGEYSGIPNPVIPFPALQKD